MRPRAPPLLFWKVRASTTCSRVTLPILVSTRPMGRPLSSLMAGMPPELVGAAGAAAPAGPEEPAAGGVAAAPDRLGSSGAPAGIVGGVACDIESVLAGNVQRWVHPIPDRPARRRGPTGPGFL